MSRKPGSCTICEGSNLASVCTSCVNHSYSLNEHYNELKALKSEQDLLYSRLSDALAAKGKADDQLSWKALHNEKLGVLREKLRISEDQLLQVKAKRTAMSHELNARFELLNSAESLLAKRMSELDKYYPNWIQTQKLGHMELTRELLHKQSVVISQICKLFPQCQASLLNWIIPPNVQSRYAAVVSTRAARISLAYRFHLSNSENTGMLFCLHSTFF